MERAELLERLAYVCDRLKADGFNGFFSLGSDYAKFAKALQKVFNTQIGFRSIWFAQREVRDYYTSNARIVIEFYEFGSRTLEYTSNGEDRKHRDGTIERRITDQQLSDTIEVLNQLCEYREKKIEETMKNKPIEELYPDIERIAGNVLYNTNYTAKFESGKRNLDSESYTCLVVRDNKRNEYIGSIVFNRNKFGAYSMTTRVPLCGESSQPFTIDTLENVLSDCLSFIIS